MRRPFRAPTRQNIAGYWNEGMQTESARVTVLMPVRNVAPYVQVAVASVLEQTFRGIRLLVIDDASEDGSCEILAGVRDERLVLLRNQRHRGLVATLNRGLDLAGTEYLARMDADDVIAPDRLARQISFLDRHPEVGACGTDIATFADDGVLERYTYRRRHERIAPLLLFFNAMPHASAMFRLSALRRSRVRYRDTFRHAEDWDLWWQFTRTERVATIGPALYFYRQHPGNVSARYRSEQIASENRIYREMLGALDLEPGDDELALHRRIAECAPLPDPGFTATEAAAALAWLAGLLHANARARVFPQGDLAAAVAFYARRIAGSSPGRHVAFARALLCRHGLIGLGALADCWAAMASAGAGHVAQAVRRRLGPADPGSDAVALNRALDGGAGPQTSPLVPETPLLRAARPIRAG